MSQFPVEGIIPLPGRWALRREAESVYCGRTFGKNMKLDKRGEMAWKKNKLHFNDRLVKGVIQP